MWHLQGVRRPGLVGGACGALRGRCQPLQQCAVHPGRSQEPPAGLRDRGLRWRWHGVHRALRVLRRGHRLQLCTVMFYWTVIVEANVLERGAEGHPVARSRRADGGRAPQARGGGEPPPLGAPRPGRGSPRGRCRLPGGAVGLRPQAPLPQPCDHTRGLVASVPQHSAPVGGGVRPRLHAGQGDPDILRREVRPRERRLLGAGQPAGPRGRDVRPTGRRL
mmetsp:Transcript_141555/g.394521  ORF Transcript_141555/g.394521 Transcript_141555/m.394521 type:complete len:220 (-) Transcript_141555:725-1384(-)